MTDQKKPKIVVRQEVVEVAHDLLLLLLEKNVLNTGTFGELLITLVCPHCTVNAKCMVPGLYAPLVGAMQGKDMESAKKALEEMGKRAEVILKEYESRGGVNAGT